MTKISAITPCYKMAKYLPKFLESLPKQTIFEHVEIILDHNDPSEEEIALVATFMQKHPGRIKHIITRPVDPIGVSMNRCIRESSGEYLCIWNVDDLRTDDSLESQLRLFESDPDVDIANGSFTIVKEFGKTIGEKIDHSMHPRNEYFRSMILGPFFMFRKSLLEKSGVFDEQLKSGADFDLAIRLATNANKIGYSEKMLGYYLNEGKGASTNGDGKQPTERTVIELRYGIIDKIEPSFLHRAMNQYDVRNILVDKEKIPVSIYLQNYEKWIWNNWKVK